MSGNLRGHWPLAENSGATAYDYSGNEHHGSISGAGPQGTGTVTGPFGNSAYDFDGTDDYVSTGDLSNFEDKIGSISAWIRPNHDSTNKVVFSEANSSDNTPQILVQVDVNNQTQLYFRDDTGSSNTSNGTTVTDGAWLHVVATVNTSTMRMYENSVEVGSSSVPSGSVTLDLSGIGVLNKSTDQDYFNGAISNVMVYDRELTPQEIQYLYQAGVSSELTMDQI